MRTEMEHAESYSYIENKLGLEGGRNHCSMFFTFMETYCKLYAGYPEKYSMATVHSIFLSLVCLTNY